MRIFVWRVCTGTLATGPMVANRPKMGSHRCCRCGEKEETDRHVLLHCSFARVACLQVALDIERMRRRVRCWKEVFEYLGSMGEYLGESFF